MKRVVVTGGNGFVGKHICSQLAAQGWNVTSVVRKQSNEELPRGVEEFVIPQIDGDTNWRQVLHQVDAVVHLLGRAHIVKDDAADKLAAFRTVNVDITRGLVHSCMAVGVRRFVFISSVKATGEGASFDYTEDTACQPEDAYGISKLEAERLLSNLAEDRLETVVIRPPLIYGPGVKANFLRLVEIVDKGIPLPLGSIQNARSIIYVGNLANAIVNSLTNPAAKGQTYFVSDDGAPSTPDLIRTIGTHLGRPARLFSVPKCFLQLAGLLTGKRQQVDRLISSLTVSNEKIKHELGWRPPYSLHHGLQATIDWYRKRS